MQDRNGQLVYLDGIDGAGKTTVARALRERCAPDRLLTVSKSQFNTGDADLDAYLRSVNTTVYQRPAHVGARCGDRYWLFALAAWYELLDELVLRPALAAGHLVLMDNPPAKTIARYLVSGTVEPGLVQAAFAGLTKPDLLLLFDVDPAVALRRKGSFTHVESGGRSDEQEYLGYQHAVREALIGPATAGQPRVVIDTTNRTVDEVVELAWAGIVPLLDPAGALR